MNEVVLKHSETNAPDLRIYWHADFANMVLIIEADFISPYLLVTFLDSMQDSDDRFTKTGITGAVQICNRFNVRLQMSWGALFEVRAFQPMRLDAPVGRPEIELFVIGSDKQQGKMFYE